MLSSPTQIFHPEAEKLTTRINQSVLYLYQTFKDRTPVIISDVLLSFFNFYSREKIVISNICSWDNV